ncbi:2-deoxy-glucose resistant protein 2 [Ricinus communis]|uniref:WD-repeat protein, putative n=1 Tax=Ricinus communis TaxID=3988 RepID=B9RYR0_RICCO|nr:2-deoxy-glucose resistant protein 2 [Ricinus communis]EEF43412.1 WD-repeat protein, putative [Ricinus communis]|eukprot:XP_002518879.1 2-deoxy-glucose resistant protein 2 [Ricinus communis]
MGNYSEEEEERFFDSREETSSMSDSGSNVYEDCSSSIDFDYSLLSESQYEVWIKSPESVYDRRDRFLKWMNSDQNTISEGDSINESFTKTQLGIDRLMDTTGAVLRTSGLGDGLLSTETPVSSQSSETQESLEDGSVDDNFVCTIRNLDDGTEFVVDELDQDGMLSRLRKVGSNQSLSFEEFQRTIGVSSLVQRFSSKYGGEARDLIEEKKKTKGSWLRRLGKSNHAARVVDRHGATAFKNNDREMQRVKVHPSKKRSKELSSLYSGQEFLAHDGSILTMKFSPDGQYLASGGEDSVVRVWKVIEDDRLDQFHIQANDTSCVYFTMNHLSEIASLNVDKMKSEKTKKHISSDSTCVIFPPKVFRVLEKPLHEFHGHSGEVLDLSWSKKRFLLSSSVDKTVRLWQVGCDRCLRVFSHNNYVTCVDFNPMDDNYFISGSIDGKVRIWEVIRCLVVDYTVIREIVTAVCYRPGGKGGIVGTMTGNCLFYDIIDNKLQLDSQISLQGKKKLTGRRITGFEFSPSDPSKVVVTSADSLVRVLCGMDVICKFRASSIGVAANQMSASFTSDGKHVLSTSEDSNIYVWNYNSEEKSSSRVKKIQSYQSFASQNASIAIPWCGIENVPGPLVPPKADGDLSGNSGLHGHSHHKFFGETDHKVLPSSPDCFSLTRGLLLDSLTRGSATWPEEKLPDSSPVALSPTKCKEYRFLKSACNSIFSSPHLWGLVIVTAGWDGRIRTYLNYGLPLRI